MAKIHWGPKKLETFPTATVPGTLHDVDFLLKDSQRFADSGGWGWGTFKYDAASGKFTPATTADMPPQGNDAKCGLGCHTIVKGRDYVFTDYGKRYEPLPLEPVDQVRHRGGGETGVPRDLPRAHGAQPLSSGSRPMLRRLQRRAAPSVEVRVRPPEVVENYEQ